MKTTIAPNYVTTYLNQNINGGQIFSVGVQGREKRLVGRLVGTNGNVFDIKPMNGEKGTKPERIHVKSVTVLKIRGNEVNLFD